MTNETRCATCAHWAGAATDTGRWRCRAVPVVPHDATFAGTAMAEARAYSHEMWAGAFYTSNLFGCVLWEAK